MSHAYSSPRSYYDNPQPYSPAQQYSPPAAEYSDRERGRGEREYENPFERGEEFDIEADFNNVGPRYTDIYHNEPKEEVGGTLGSVGGDRKSRFGSLRPKSYYSNAPARSEFGDSRSKSGHSPSAVELVTVPALGAEWGKEELHSLSRRGKAERKAERRSKKWMEWNRDQRGVLGVKWATRKGLVWGAFGLCILIGLVLFFVIPRAPSFTLPTSNIMSVDNTTISFSRSPTNYTFSGTINLFAKTSNSYLPLHFTHLYTSVYDSTTNKLIGTGDLGNRKWERGDNVPVRLPVKFEYVAVNATDATWLDMYNSCGHLWGGTVRPALRVLVEMHIMGLVTKPKTSFEIADLACPFELSATSV